MIDMLEEYLTAPASDFDYRMRTTAVMEHSRGVAWTADLLLHGARVGTIEQEGNGGCDRVYLDTPDHRAHWKQSVASAFGGSEEAATLWLLCQEEAANDVQSS